MKVLSVLTVSMEHLQQDTEPQNADLKDAISHFVAYHQVGQVPL